MVQFITLTFIAFLLLTPRVWAAESLNAVGFFLEQNQPEKAILWLEENLAKPGISNEEKESSLFALGKLLFDRGVNDSSEKYFEQIAGPKSEYSDWAELYLGKISQRNEEWKRAERYLKPLIQGNKSFKIRLDAREALAKTAMGQSHWRDASAHLRYLERRTRGDEEHAQHVWNLIKTERKSGRSSQSCYWARKFYTDYPGHKLSASWGLNLRKNIYEGHPLNCPETSRDRRKRIKRFQWIGMASHAKEEIDLVTPKDWSKASAETQMLWAEYYLQEGLAGEALKILLPKYNTQHKDNDYLMNLAKAAARAGEVSSAVAAYYRVYSLNPRSRSSKTALFQAAFLSYQSQDYDGATRKFEEFNRKYPSSGLVRDASWYIAWIKYLKGNYKSAAKSFNKLLAEKKRQRRWWRSFPEDRLRYWLAMSYFHQGDEEAAALQFQRLAEAGDRDYYSLLASHRLSGLQNQPLVREVSSMTAEETENVASNEELSAEGSSEESASDEIAEENESEEVIDRLEEQSVGESGTESESAADEAASKEDSEYAAVTDQFVDYFKDSRLGPYFFRAKKFTYMGFTDLAKWELYEIERRTRDTQQLNAVAYQYHLIGSYHRSSYISEVKFLSRARSADMQGFADYWKYAYPQAFESSVTDSAKTFNVPQEFIWSIMRAESRYRSDVRSPVGATGLMQIMPYTAKRLVNLLGDEAEKADKLTDPATNIRLGSRYLRRLLSKFDDKIPLAAASYNAGPHRVDSWLYSFGRLSMDEFIEHIPFAETRNYVKKVVQNYHTYNELYRGKKASTLWLLENLKVVPSVTDFQRENWEEAGI